MFKKLLIATLAVLVLAGCAHKPPVTPAPEPVPLTAHVNTGNGDAISTATAYWDGGQSASVDDYGRHTFTVQSDNRFGFCAKAPSFFAQCLDTDLQTGIRDQFFVLGPTAPPPPVYKIPTGQPHRVDRSIADDRGKYLEFGATLFPTQWLYLNDLPRLKANLEFLAKYGANPRILLVVSTEGQWAHRYVNPQSPEWATAYVETIKLAYSYGLRPFVSIFGDPCCEPAARAAIIAHVVQLTRDNNLSDKITAFEVANEHALSDVGEMESYARQLLAVHPLVALSSTEDFDGGPNLVYAGHVATFFQMHPDRDINGDGGIWRPSRQPYGYREFNIPSIGGNGEPRGRASSISNLDALPADEAANVTAADMLMTYLSGFVQYVLHDGSGVYLEETNDNHGHRYNNLFDSPIAVTIFEAAAKLHAWLPTNLADWNNLTHSDPSRNGQFAFATYPNESFDAQYHQCGMRSYTAYYGAHGLTVTLGQCSDFDLIGRADTSTDVIIRALTGETLETFTLAPNQHHLFHRYAGSVALDTWFHQ